MQKNGNFKLISISIFLLLFTFALTFLKYKLFSPQINFVKAQSLNSADWPQLQHDSGHSGYIADTYLPDKEIWRITSTSTPKAPPVSSRVQPVVANNIVYIPSNDSKLYAFSATDGHLLWTYQTGSPLVASAAVDTSSNTVIVGSLDRNIYGINATTGAQKWIYPTDGMFRSAPVIDNTGAVFLGSSNGNLYSIKASTGALIWSKYLSDPIWETPAVYNNMIFVGTMAAKAYALNSSTGSLIWQKQLRGQGLRDRWVSAGNGKVIFTPNPINGSKASQEDSTATLNPVSGSDWPTQRQTILTHINQNPNYQAVYIFDAATGAETTPPILYTSGGSTSQHSQPVILPNGNFNFIYRYTEGRPNPGCGATCNFYSQYAGEYNPTTNDITRLDTWGSGSAMDTNLKIPFISDESSVFMRTGNILYVDTSRGTLGFNTLTKTIIPFTTYNISSGGVFWNPPIKFYPLISGNGWINQYPGSEVSSDGNDYKRPTAIANGVFFILHNSQLVAVSGKKQ